jgi:hypothetical protein
VFISFWNQEEGGVYTFVNSELKSFFTREVDGFLVEYEEGKFNNGNTYVPSDKKLTLFCLREIQTNLRK